jgi:hypothetical protein
MSAIDEVWEADESGIRVVGNGYWIGNGIDLENEDEPDAGVDERAKLAAAAPELARALLAAEWVKREYKTTNYHGGRDSVWEECPLACGARRNQNDEGQPMPQYDRPHAPTCPIELSLRKAGRR